MLRTIESGLTESITFTPDGSLLLAAEQSGHITAWRVADGTLVGTLIASEKGSLVVMADGRYRAFGNGAEDLGYRIGMVRFTPEQAQRFSSRQL